MTPLFALAGVEVRAGGRVLLHRLDLELDGAGIVGLIGHNGSGKSTLLRVLARQVAPAAGRLWFDGQPIDAWDSRAFARQLAYLPQDPAPSGGLLVRELVALGRYPWHGALGRLGPADHAAVERAMALTGVATMADRPVMDLSGGERQCAWIAMCVAQGRRCLLLDEPTAALDVQHQRQVLDTVRLLARECGIAIVLVLHDVNLAARCCDELLALRGGRVIARGTPEAVLQRDTLRGIYGLDLGLLPRPGGGAPVAFLP